jgi:hypothetical protein
VRAVILEIVEEGVQEPEEVKARGRCCWWIMGAFG